MNMSSNPIKNAVIRGNITYLNLDDCNIETLDYSQVKSLQSISLYGNPKWSDYIELMMGILDTETDESYKYMSIDTDYDLIGKNTEQIRDITNRFGDQTYMYFGVEYYNLNVDAPVHGVIYLENNPALRRAFMNTLKNGSGANPYYTVNDRGVTSITINDTFADSYTIPLYINNAGGIRNMIARNLVLNFR